MDKEEIRKAIKIRKTFLSDSEQKEASKQLCTNLLRLIKELHSRKILLYHALPDEISLNPLLEELSLNKEKTLLLPSVLGNDLELRRYDGADSLKRGQFGILEPISMKEASWDNIDLAIIPGVAFTYKGERLGRGKGYYDRLLPDLHNAWKIGVCYECQIMNLLPHEPHDVLMDQVITDREISKN